jgi:hypothetical protein
MMEARKLSKLVSELFQLSLRIRHPSLDPADLSREFLIEAEHSFRAGDPRPSRSGLAPASVHAESYWLGALNPASWIRLPFAEPRLQLAQQGLGAVVSRSLGSALSLSARFLSLHAQTLHRIRAEGGEISLLVSVPTGEVGSFSLAPEVSRIFGELGVALEFELTSD